MTLRRRASALLLSSLRRSRLLTSWFATGRVWDWLFQKSSARRGPTYRRARLNLELLEAREVPSASLAFSASSLSTLDEGGTQTFTLTRSGTSSDLSHSLTAYISIGDTSGLTHAVQGVDYRVSTPAGNQPTGGGNVGFAANQTEITFTVTGLRDNLVDPGEGFQVALVSNANYAIGSNGSVSVPLGDDPPTLTLDTNIAVGPGQSGTVTLHRTGGDTTKALTGYVVIADVSGYAHAYPTLDYRINRADGSVLPSGGGSVGFAANSTDAVLTITNLRAASSSAPRAFQISLNNYAPTIEVISTPNAAIVDLLAGNASTTTSFTASPTSSVFGQLVTFTATVVSADPYAGTPSGTVTFKDGSTTLGTGTLNSSGVATYTTTSANILAVGSRSISVSVR